MKYRSIVVSQYGGPENLVVEEFEKRSPGPGEVGIKVLAAQVSAPDVTARYGDSPFVPKLPFTPGYAFIGLVDAVGEDVTEWEVGDKLGALTAYGSYTEYIYWDAEKCIPCPYDLDPGEAVTILLNYLVAYHSMHWRTQVSAGETMLIIGASGGIGTALLQLGKLAGMKMYGLASASKHHILEAYGAIPIDYRTQDFVEVIRAAEPDGLDKVFDGMAGDYIKRGFGLFKKGGVWVGYGNPLGIKEMVQILGRVGLYTVLPNGRVAKYYSTGLSNYNWEKYLADWDYLFRMLANREIEPVVHARFPILEARKANEILESGDVVGNVVLMAPKLL